MSKLYRELEAQLRQAMGSKSYLGILHNAGARHVDLTAYSTVQGLLDVMANPDPDRYPEKESITRAAIFESQKHGHEFWSSFLLLSYLPMLRKIRWRVRTSPVSRDDLDQSVLDCFLTTVHDFPLDAHETHTCMRLRVLTQRAVFSLVNKEQQVMNSTVEYRDEEISEGMASAFTSGPRLTPTLSASDREDAAQTLRERLSRYVLPQPGLDLVAESARTPRRLRSLVWSAFWDQNEDDRERIYQRLKKQRNRLKKELRPILEGTAAQQMVLPMSGLEQKRSSLLELVESLVPATNNAEADFSTLPARTVPPARRTDFNSERIECSGGR